MSYLIIHIAYRFTPNGITCWPNCKPYWEHSKLLVYATVILFNVVNSHKSDAECAVIHVFCAHNTIEVMFQVMVDVVSLYENLGVAFTHRAFVDPNIEITFPWF